MLPTKFAVQIPNKRDVIYELTLRCLINVRVLINVRMETLEKTINLMVLINVRGGNIVENLTNLQVQNFVICGNYPYLI